MSVVWFDKFPHEIRSKASNWKGFRDFHWWEMEKIGFLFVVICRSNPFFYCLFAGKYSAYFTVTELQHGKLISMRTESFFLLYSAISIDFEVKNNSTTVVFIQHYFDVDSKLFHDTLGVPLRALYQEKFNRALENLKMLLCDLQNEGLLL